MRLKNSFSSIDLKALIKYLPTLLVVIFILYFYIWGGTRGDFKFGLHLPAYGMYNMLAESFAKGMVELPVKPNPEMLKLEDPYDPWQNYKIRMHDASFYKGKYYLYFGPSPVITLLLPYYWITGGKQMPYSLAIMIFCCFAFLFTTFIFLHLRRKFFPDIPEWIFAFSLLVVGFSNMAGWVLRRYDIYETAISCGFMFSTGGLYFFLTAFENKKIRIFRLMMGSLLFGIAFGARLHFIVPISAVFLLAGINLLLNNSYNWKSKFLKMFLMVLPFTICVSSMLWYNYVRFDDPLQHGGKYQLAADHIKYFKQFQLDVIPINIQTYFFHKLRYSKTEFPHLFLRSWSSPYPVPPYFYMPGWMGGMVYVIPFLVLLLLAPVYFWFQRTLFCRKEKLQWHMPIVFFVGAVVLFFSTNYLLKFLSEHSVLKDFYETFVKYKTVIPLKLLIPSLLSLGTYFWIITFKEKSSDIYKVKSNLLSYEVGVLALFFTTLIGFLLTVNYSQFRYYPDFTTPILAITCFTWFTFDKYMNNKYYTKYILRFVVVLLGIASIVIAFALSIVGEGNALRWSNPKEYQKLENAYNFITMKWIKDFSLKSYLVSKNHNVVMKPFLLQPKSSDVWKIKSTEYVFNGSHWIIKGDDRTYGPIKMRVKFPEVREVGKYEPLIVSGNNDAGNYTYVGYRYNNEIVFAFDHGDGGLVSNSYVIDPNKIYEIEISTGDLYPKDGIKREILDSVIIKLDGKEVFRTKNYFYPVEKNLQIGINNLNGKSTEKEFSGQILGYKQLGLVSDYFSSSYGPIKMKVKFSGDKSSGYEPLLVTGENEAGNYTIVGYMANNKIVLAFDHGNGGAISDEVKIDPKKYYDVEISTGDLYPEEDIRKEVKGTVTIKLNGKKIYDLRRNTYKSSPSNYGIGINHLDGASCAKKFTGEIKDVQRVGLKVSDFSTMIGSYKMKVQFPKDRSDGYEPILVSGDYSMGNYLYVGYKDDSNIVFAFDHGNGSEPSAPIMIDPSQFYELEVSTGDLYPEFGVKEKYLTYAFVKLNGKEVFKTKAWFFSSKPTEVYVGENKFAGMSCSKKFTGVIKDVKQEGFDFN